MTQSVSWKHLAFLFWSAARSICWVLITKRASPSACHVWEECQITEKSVNVSMKIEMNKDAHRYSIIGFESCKAIHIQGVAVSTWLWGKSLQVVDEWQPFIPQLSDSQSGLGARVCWWWLVMPPASLFFLQLEIREQALQERANLDSFPLYFNVPSTGPSNCLSMGWWIDG